VNSGAGRAHSSSANRGLPEDGADAPASGGVRRMAWLLLGASPSLVAGCWLLVHAGLGGHVLMAHGLAIVGMLAVAGGGAIWLRRSCRRRCAWLLLASIGLLLVPFAGAVRPARWLELGNLAVYLAPLLTPSVLVIAVAARRWPGHWPAFVAAVLGVLAVVFAMQPDRAQALATALACSCVLLASPRANRWCWLAALPHVVAVAVCVPRPDTLPPVAHVELVFALGLQLSPWLGLALIAAAVVALGALAFVLVGWQRAAVAIPVYYGALYLASIAGWTPAPLLGFGAGPLLGFGLLLAFVSALVDADRGAGSRGS